MRVPPTFQNAVAFIGHEAPGLPGDFRASGTGFLLHYDGGAYLVTCRHVVESLDGAPFAVRVNRWKDGGCNVIPGDDVKWFTPKDAKIDLAVAEFPALNEAGYQCMYVPSALMLDKYPNEVDAGDICYTIGLFRYVSGSKRNLPVVYSGNIALNTSEEIPYIDKRTKKEAVTEGRLVQSLGIDGLSGAPVFVRPTFTINGIMDNLGRPTPVDGGRHDLFLYGVMQGAWFLPPDANLRAELGANIHDKVPIGLGIVAPVSRLTELLERDDVKQARDAKPKHHLAEPTVAVSAGAAKGAENPAHREDFKRLLGAAVKQPKSSD